MKCYVCRQMKRREDLRAYGVDGQLICYPCMKSTPEREAECERQLGEAMSGSGPHLLTATGVRERGEV